MTTTPRGLSRPGGRSFRVQNAVHRATADLLTSHGRAALTVPLIAARAGVTPSTIYRRWGELADLLADVAVERIRPDADPADTGSLAGDLLAWAEQYRDEMSSEVGMGLMLDVLSARRRALDEASKPLPCQCVAFTASQIATIIARGIARGEDVPEIDAVLDTVVSPIIFRSLFGQRPASVAQVQAWVAACLKAKAPRAAPER